MKNESAEICLILTTVRFTNRMLCVAFSFLTLALPPKCAAQVPPSIGAVVLAVGEPGDPLRIVEFRPRLQALKGPYTVVRNFSDKPVAGFRLSAAMSSPAQCLSEAPTSAESQATESYGSYSDRGFKHTSVLAGNSVSVYWNLLGPSNLVWQARRLKSSYAQFQVSVSEVQFQDGTLWKRSTPVFKFLELDEMRKVIPTDCQPWKQMNAALAGVTEVQYPQNTAPGYPLRAPDGVSFVYSCRIVGHMAVCPTGNPERR